MRLPFIGRKQELNELSELLEKKTASLVVIQGRRRIGKSRLVEEFAKPYTFYQFSGNPPTTETTTQWQLDEFARQLSRQTKTPLIAADSWGNQFYLLYQQIKAGRVIVLFDEISWMGSKDPEFLGHLKTAWDIYFKKNPELILILCGSVSPWIEKNILSSTGFVGRLSLRLTLEELSLSECNQFWLQNGDYISPYQKFKVLAVTGGVPRYLEEIKTSLSAEDTIRNLCFTKNGLLVHEFNDIFSDLFSRRTPTYKRIVELLANGSMEIKDIGEALDLAQSGALSEYLDDLIKSGFVERDYTWLLSSGKSSRLSHFRLSDNYIRFYLKYIDPHLMKIEKNDFAYSSLSALPGWNSIMGLQFENLVLRNRNYIKEALGLASQDIESNNPFFQRMTKKHPGCQIDYLIQTRFNILYVCEFKFLKDAVGKGVINEVQQKIARLAPPKRFSILPVLVHVNGVSQEVVKSGFFAKIIDFGNALGDQSR
ncbi:MAG: AAA family ATPase [Parachlamydiaceae bacterium]|nr:AAA family ATPase [Parachlamydiaceae bacterium]